MSRPDTTALRPRLDLEVAQWSRAHPRAWRALRGTARRPALVLVPLAVLLACTWSALSTVGDLPLFERAAAQLWSPSGLHVFDAPQLQVGPVYLAVIGAIAGVARAVHLSPDVVVSGVAAGFLTWLSLAVTARLAVDQVQRLRAQWAVGLVLVLGGFLYDTISYGHAEELTVGLLAVVAALQVERGRSVRAGLTLGLATVLKLWAPATAGVVLRGRRPRVVILSALTAMAVTVVFYLPFFLGGQPRTFEHSWNGFADQHSLFMQVVRVSGLDEWTLRLAQAALAFLAGAAVAWWGRTGLLGPVIVAISVRLALDPLQLSYYAVPLVVLCVMWWWTSSAPVIVRSRLALTYLTPLVVLNSAFVLGRYASLGASLVLIGLVVAVVVLDRPSTPRADPDDDEADLSDGPSDLRTAAEQVLVAR